MKTWNINAAKHLCMYGTISVYFAAIADLTAAPPPMYNYYEQKVDLMQPDAFSFSRYPGECHNFPMLDRILESMS